MKNSDDVGNGPTGMQRIAEELQVKIVYNKEDDWEFDVNVTQLTEKRIRDVVEARADNGGYDPSTMKYALMNKFRVPEPAAGRQVALDQSMRFEPGVLPRSQDLITEEGHLTLTRSYLVPNAH